MIFSVYEVQKRRGRLRVKMLQKRIISSIIYTCIVTFIQILPTIPKNLNITSKDKDIFYHFLKLGWLVNMVYEQAYGESVLTG